MDAAPERPTAETPEAVQQLGAAVERIRSELEQAVVGQRRVIDELLATILSGGHCLLVGVPGLAKTMLVRSLASTMGLDFNRVQFTPDLMPADITGTEVIQEDRGTGERVLKFLKGPIFANVVLADEINRTPPKTQAALLEAMQERQVTVGGQRYELPAPFFVLATQNPIEQEGTYPLPEAQLDRFMLEVRVDYPSEDEEFEVVRRTTSQQPVDCRQVITREELERMQETVRVIPMADHDIRYAMALVRATRAGDEKTPEVVQQYVRWGAGPRASQYLVMAAKARAAMEGRLVATSQDVREMIFPVLRHRIVPNFNADADHVDIDSVIRRLLEEIPAPPVSDSLTQRFGKFFKAN